MGSSVIVLVILFCLTVYGLAACRRPAPPADGTLAADPPIEQNRGGVVMRVKDVTVLPTSFLRQYKGSLDLGWQKVYQASVIERVITIGIIDIEVENAGDIPISIYPRQGEVETSGERVHLELCPSEFGGSMQPKARVEGKVFFFLKRRKYSDIPWIRYSTGAPVDSAGSPLAEEGYRFVAKVVLE